MSSIKKLVDEARAKGKRGQEVTDYVTAEIVAESNRREEAARAADERS